MSMQENDVLARLRQAREERTQNPVLSRLQARRDSSAEERAEITIQDETQGGFFSQLVRGAQVGALEPLGFLPPVSRFLDAHVGQETPHVGQKIGYALGWLGGTALPAGAALKLAAAGMRGARLISAADAFVDLGMKGNLIRGGLAGAMLGAGRDAEDGGERVSNLLREAAYFGIGDAIAHPLMRAISGASVWPGGSRALDKVEEIANAEVVEGVDGAQILARAQRVLNTIIPDAEAASNVGAGARKTALRLGLSRLDLQDLARGETRIIPSIRGDALDIGTLLNNVPEVSYRVIKRKVGGVDVSDVLVAPKGELDERLVSTYVRNLDKHGVGFFPGQVVRWKGADRIVMGASKSGKLETYLLGTGGKVGSKEGVSYVPIDEAVFMPHGAWRTGPASVPGAASEWVKFIREFGEFPEVGFENAFKQTAQRLALDENQSKELMDYFSKRLNESLASIDKPLGDVLSNLRKNRPGAHPDGPLAEIAAQTGYIVGHDVATIVPVESSGVGVRAIPAPSKGLRGVQVQFKEAITTEVDFEEQLATRAAVTRDPGGKGWRVTYMNGETPVAHESFGTYEKATESLRNQLRRADLVDEDITVSVNSAVDQENRIRTVVRDARSGNVLTFATDQDALAYIKENPLQVPDLVQDLRPPIPTNQLGLQGTAVVPEHTAVDIANAKVPWSMLTFGGSFLPRLAWFRMMDDTLLAQGVKTRLFPTASKLQQRILLARNQREPWLERLQSFRTKGIREDYGKLVAIRDSMLQPDAALPGIAKSAGLNAEEVTAARELKTYMRDLIKDMNVHSKLDIDPDEFLEEYLPYIITREPAGTAKASWNVRLEEAFAARGKKVNGRMMKFAEEMERAGINPGRLESNPFMVALRWTTTAFTKRHVDEAFLEARTLLETLPTDGVGGVIRRSFEDAIKVSYGGTPEAYYVARIAASGYFKNLGIELESKDFDRLISSLISMNYGAFMGFRPALALRNLTQMIFTTLPMVQSPKHFAAGIRRGFTKAGRDEAFEALAIPTQSSAVPFEDKISRDALFSMMARASDKPTLMGQLLKLTTKGSELAHTGLGGSVKIGNFELTTGLYGKMDDVNRAVAYHAQKSKTLEAMGDWMGTSGKVGHQNITRFNEDAGLTQFGEAITQEFHRKLSLEGTDEAVRWVSVQMANETQWIYQMGAGPAAFSQGFGRLFGMYGTWPSWYAQHLIRGATRGTPRDKARFWAWTAATAAAVPAATYATGVNFSRWSPLNSLTWTGGPALDWFADWRDIVSGAAPPGEPPTARRALALAERGIRDTGQRAPVPFVGHLDPREGVGLDVQEPLRIGRDLLYLFTPGAGQVQDILDATQAPTPAAAALTAAGFEPVAGHSWPRIQVR